MIALSDRGTRPRALDTCPLTSRELATLELLAEGFVYKEIALRHGVSQSAVRDHLHRVYRKIGAIDRANAVIIAERAGWIRPPSMSPSNRLLYDVRAALQRLERRLPLNRRERSMLAQFEHQLTLADRGPEMDSMLDNLGAVLNFVAQYGSVPNRYRPPRPTDTTNITNTREL